ncbi:CHAD domain-containing protein [Antarcticirhabdus aurantiaca]|uniref:CHAD domain-containing protein n=1 Tax=Antarcticirhabdus aurantiaca TaxID=2606717 RepID=A0ACD4NUQ2_9HYPH|nr:CHAD domain-containing protein [Antarcticirhabdus aurantiaca]WAJ30474.1 CHAD domain-containing protein [Jeongeuplla avenae]
MAYRLDPHRPPAEEIARVAGEELEKAAAELRDPDADQGEAIHDVRKRLKKLRGLLRFARESDARLYRRENARLRDAARSLSAVRDRTALIESLDALQEHVGASVAPASFAAIRAALEHKRQVVVASEGDVGARVSQVIEVLDGALEDWRERRAVGASQGRSSLLHGLEENYRRARTALKTATASGDAEDFHDLRKRAKYHAMHLKLLADIWPDVLTPARKAADGVADALGSDHDYAVLLGEMEAEPQLFGAQTHRARIAALASTRQRELRVEALAACARLFAEKPKAFRRRIAAYLDRAAAEGAARDAARETKLVA